MNPDSAKKSHDHKSGLWWRRWSGSIAFFLVIIISAGGFAKIQHDAHIREKQFCELVLGRHDEKRDSIAATKDFLATPSEELPATLNDLKGYIRGVSLPMREKEFIGEERDIPTLCLKYEGSDDK